MERKVVVQAIQKIMLDIKEKCIIKNTAIRDSIFCILENECTVIYYLNKKKRQNDINDFFTRMPIILTEESDIDILRSITKRKMGNETYALDIQCSRFT